jgi:hypothetical protein
LAGEVQSGSFNTKTYTNTYGKPGVLQTNDDIRPNIYSIFAQADLQFPKDWNVTVGLSSNQSSIEINRISVANFTPCKTNFQQ